MFKGFLNRVLQVVLLLFFVSGLVFWLTSVLPGDPTFAIVGETANEAERELARQQYGLDRPLVVQYADWLGRAVTGDFGRSLRGKTPVIELLQQRLPVTLELTALGILFAVAIGLPMGILSAKFRNSWIDVAANFGALTGMATPFFWLGLLLIMFFAVRLHWLPASGYVRPTEDLVQNLRLMILPALTIGVAFAATLMRQTRASMLNVMSLDYIRTARAKGAPERIVVLKHALRNSLIPVITVIGLQVGGLLGGAIVTENVFSLPGIGRLLVEGIYARDYPVIQGGLLFVVFAVVTVNLLTDSAYRLLDPRTRL